VDGGGGWHLTLAGFLASIGYIVLVKGLRIAIPLDVWSAGPTNPWWWIFLSPAVPMGLILYLRGRFKCGNPALMLPLLLIVPLVCFYIVLYATGSDVGSARQQGWMFQELDYTVCWQLAGGWQAG
jgi:hypothetical protein